MAACFSSDWKNDLTLKEDLSSFILQRLQRAEILDYMQRDYSHYNWSLRTLDRRLRFFDIYYTDRTVTVGEARLAVREELNGPGCLLGYRAMQLKLRQKHGLKIPRDRVYDIMYDEDKALLEARRPGSKKKKKKINFITKGSDWVYSLDGHDKLMGYQNSTFPLAIYGCLDTSSRKIIFLRVWNTNSKPEIVGRWYLEYIFESRKIPNFLRLDKGTETNTMAVMHCYLRKDHTDLIDATDSVIYGPSTSNQVRKRVY